MGSWSLLCLIGITLCIAPLVALVNLISSLFAGNAAENLLTQVLGIPLILRILLIAVWPAIVEEYVFRGLFYRGLRRHGMWKAALVSALFFGLIHMNFNQFTYAFILGIVMAVAVEATGTIHASVTIHICLNLPSVLLSGALQAPSARVLPAMHAFLLSAAGGAQDAYSYLNNPAYLTMEIMMIAFLAVIGTPLVVVLMKKLIRLNEREDYMSWVLNGGEAEALKKRPPEKIVDFYFIAAVVICLAYMVISLFR